MSSRTDAAGREEGEHAAAQGHAAAVQTGSELLHGLTVHMSKFPSAEKLLQSIQICNEVEGQLYDSRKVRKAASTHKPRF